MQPTSILALVTFAIGCYAQLSGKELADGIDGLTKQITDTRAAIKKVSQLLTSTLENTLVVPDVYAKLLIVMKNFDEKFNTKLDFTETEQEQICDPLKELTREHIQFLYDVINRQSVILEGSHYTIWRDVDNDSFYEDLRTDAVLRAAPGCNDTALVEDMALLDKTFEAALNAYWTAGNNA